MQKEKIKRFFYFFLSFCIFAFFFLLQIQIQYNDKNYVLLRGYQKKKKAFSYYLMIVFSNGFSSSEPQIESSFFSCFIQKGISSQQ